MAPSVVAVGVEPCSSPWRGPVPVVPLVTARNPDSLAAVHAQPGAVVTATCSAPAVHSTSRRSGVTMNAHGTSGRHQRAARHLAAVDHRRHLANVGAAGLHAGVEPRLGSMLFARPTGADRTEPASLRYRPPDGRTGPQRRK